MNEITRILSGNRSATFGEFRHNHFEDNELPGVVVVPDWRLKLKPMDATHDNVSSFVPIFALLLCAERNSWASEQIAGRIRGEKPFRAFAALLPNLLPQGVEVLPFHQNGELV